MKWISVKKELPDFDKTVLVYCHLWGRYLATYNRLGDTNYGEWKDFNNESVIPPSYWSELLDPPKE